jgi:hypothetical protein
MSVPRGVKTISLKRTFTPVIMSVDMFDALPHQTMFGGLKFFPSLTSFIIIDLKTCPKAAF